MPDSFLEAGLDVCVPMRRLGTSDGVRRRIANGCPPLAITQQSLFSALITRRADGDGQIIRRLLLLNSIEIRTFRNRDRRLSPLWHANLARNDELSGLCASEFAQGPEIPGLFRETRALRNCGTGGLGWQDSNSHMAERFWGFDFSALFALESGN